MKFGKSRGGLRPGARQRLKPHTNHCGNRVEVGAYEILAGGLQYLTIENLVQADILVPLTERIPEWIVVECEKRAITLHPLPLKDFGGVPENWSELLDAVIDMLKARKRVLAFCVASHGRTGTFLASLIAKLEHPVKTPDPIAAVRVRHCRHAVETKTQAEAIFAIRGKALPRKYHKKFNRAQ